MSVTEERLYADILQISRIPFLPLLLEVVCSATGMGFAAVARVNEERWIAGAVVDHIQFGLSAGDELEIGTTICHEIRQSHRPVVIDEVSHDAYYKNHHTPALYGFESYISFPIILESGEFFGTLCAVDPKAAQLNTPPVMDLFRTLVQLIAQYLDGIRYLTPSQLNLLELYASMKLSDSRREFANSATPAHPEKTDRLAEQIRKLIDAFGPDGKVS